MNECVIPMKSRTEAERGVRAARMYRIMATVVSVDPSVTKNGCSVGLKVPCDYAAELTYIFDSRGIGHGEIIGRFL